MTAATLRTVRSYCRICTCQCGLLVDLDGEQVVKIRGDRDHPVSRGYLCPKGRALGKVHHHPDALLQPQIRRNGSLQATDWEHCIDDIAQRLVAIIDRHGPAAVGMFFGSGLGMDAAGYRMGEALQRAIGTPARFSPMTIDGTAKVLVAALMGGFPGLSLRADYANSRLLVFAGVNPMVSHGHNIAVVNPAPIIKAVAERGEVWTIDPLRTKTADFATAHVAPRPGTDYAIFAHLLRELLAQDLAAPAQPVADLAALRAAVAPFDRERAAAIAGIEASDLDALFAALRRAGRVAVETGTGITMAASANVSQWLAWALMILTGSMNRPGGVWFHPGFINRLDAQELPIIARPFGPGAPSRPEVNGFIGEWPCAALADEIEAGNIRALINLGGSLIRSFPEANALAPALAKLDLLVTLDIVANETTALSTHVLPTRDQLERPDITLWDMLSSRLDAQQTAAVLAPRGERRSAWWVIARLMQRMGHAPAEGTPADDRAAGADEAMLGALTAHARSSYEELKAQGHVELPLDLPARWVDAHIERFGGWRLAPAELTAELAALLAAAERPAAPAGMLTLVPRRQRRRLNASPLDLGDRPTAILHPDDAAASGIVDGAGVRLGNGQGTLTAIAQVDAAIRKGVVSFPHGHAEANVNLLTSAQAVDTLTGMVRYSGVPVRVEPVTQAP